MSIAASFSALFRRNETECDIHHLPKVERTAGDTTARICLECLRERKIELQGGVPMQPSFNDEFKRQQATGMRLVENLSEVLALNAEDATAAALEAQAAQLTGAGDEKQTTMRAEDATPYRTSLDGVYRLYSPDGETLTVGGTPIVQVPGFQGVPCLVQLKASEIVAAAEATEAENAALEADAQRIVREVIADLKADAQDATDHGETLRSASEEVQCSTMTPLRVQIEQPKSVASQPSSRINADAKKKLVTKVTKKPVSKRSGNRS